MNVWRASAGKSHFLMSDNRFHLMSGWHTHGTGGSKKRIKTESFAHKEDAMLLNVIKQFISLQ